MQPLREPAHDQPSAEQRERRAAFGQVNENVIGRSAGSLRLAADVPKLFGLRININQLDLVDYPIATGKKAAPGRGGIVFHFVRRTN